MTARTVVVTGAAGLVGTNLALLLSEVGGWRVVALDRHEGNLALLARLCPGAETHVADLAEPGDWQRHFTADAPVVLLHAQIAAKEASAFERNTVEATRRVLEAMRAGGTPFAVHVGSSVVHSVVEDDYVRSKREQERLVLASGVPCCVLRPTLMFGWFDPKHLGWLARFMARVPAFPIPGDGRYPRQPLYVRDFCRAVAWCLEHRPAGRTYDIVGAEHVDYVDMIRAVRRARGLRTPLVHLPVPVFAALLRLYALFSREPPFTADQLASLTAGDDFTGVDLEREFGFAPTPFEAAIRETFTHPAYAGVAPGR